LVHPAGLPPANSPFEAEDDRNFTTDAEWPAGPKLDGRVRLGRLRSKLRRGSFVFAVRRAKAGGSPRICTEFSPVKSRDFTIKVCDPSEREGGVEPPQSDP